MALAGSLSSENTRLLNLDENLYPSENWLEYI